MHILRTHIEKTVSITDEEFAVVQSLFHPLSFKKKDYIIEKNKRVEYAFFIISGLVKLSYWDDEAKEHIVSFAMEDWWETDFQAYFTESNATFFLQCIENTETLCLSIKDYRELCSKIPKMQHFFLEKSIAGHIAAQNRIISLLTLSAKDRYEQCLRLYPSLFQRVPKALLASYLGVSRETLSRLFVASKRK